MVIDEETGTVVESMPNPPETPIDEAEEVGEIVEPPPPMGDGSDGKADDNHTSPPIWCTHDQYETLSAMADGSGMTGGELKEMCVFVRKNEKGLSFDEAQHIVEDFGAVYNEWTAFRIENKKEGDNV